MRFAVTYMMMFQKYICVKKVSDSEMGTVDKGRECFLLIL